MYSFLIFLCSTTCYMPTNVICESSWDILSTAFGGLRPSALHPPALTWTGYPLRSAVQLAVEKLASFFTLSSLTASSTQANSLPLPSRCTQTRIPSLNSSANILPKSPTPLTWMTEIVSLILLPIPLQPILHTVACQNIAQIRSYVLRLSVSKFKKRKYVLFGKC